MSKSTSQKVALITGANKGLGFETGRQLAKKGIKVFLGARDEKRGKEAEAKLKAEGLDVDFIHLDLNDAGTHLAAAKYIDDKFGRLDILINNAAVNLEGSLDVEIATASQTPLEIYRRTFETNFFDQIAVTQAFLPLIRKSNAGRIVILSSGLGSTTLHADPTSPIYDFKIPAYDVSKAAINSYAVHLAHELKDTPIKVNVAHPGWVKTEMGGENAPMEIEEGAKTSVALATLPDDGYTGKFIHLGEELPW